jgi:hypothetical protein
MNLIPIKVTAVWEIILAKQRNWELFSLTLNKETSVILSRYKKSGLGRDR